MKETKFIQTDVFGTKVNFILWEPTIPSTSAMFFYHGAGEVGPADGSQIDKIKANGPPRLITKSGYNYPFNVIAVQAVDYFTTPNRYFIQWAALKFNLKKVLFTGLSRGGQETYNLTLRTTLNYKGFKIVGAMPVAGRPDAYSTANPCTTMDIPILAIHGDKDNTVPYSQDLAWITKLDTCPTRTSSTKLITLPNVAHNSWDWAYDITDTNRETYKFYTDLLKEDVQPSYQDGYNVGLTDGYNQGESEALGKITKFINSI